MKRYRFAKTKAIDGFKYPAGTVVDADEIHPGTLATLLRMKEIAPYEPAPDLDDTTASHPPIDLPEDDPVDEPTEVDPPDEVPEEPKGEEPEGDKKSRRGKKKAA